jgi:molybdopterin-guanine dinucleotide biosynthesis protein A
MGRNKALLPYHGTTLGQSVADVVRAATGTAALVGDRLYDGLSEIGFVPDLYPGEGPLGGILSALRSSTADWNLIVACDMPELELALLRQLLDAADSCGGDALVPAGPSGRLEPLCAAYHRKALGCLEAAFARGVRKMATALEEIDTVIWPVPELSCFQNVNTPEEWAPYER